MSEHDRRTLLKGAGLGFGAGLLSSLIAPAEAAPAAGDIWSAEYWAKKGDVKLWLWRKRVGAPAAATKPVVFLVHGSSNSSRSSYDLTVPGKGEYSLINILTHYNYNI